MQWKCLMSLGSPVSFLLKSLPFRIRILTQTICPLVKNASYFLKAQSLGCLSFTAIL